MRHPTTRRPSAPVAREARRRARREARRRRREKDARATWSTRGRARASPRKTSSRAVSVPRGVRARRDSRTPRTPDGARSRVGGGSVKRPRRRVVPSARLAAPASNRDRGLIGLTRDRPVKRVDSESGDLNRKQTALFRSAVHRKTPRFFPASDNNFPRARHTDPRLTALERLRRGEPPLFAPVAGGHFDGRRRGLPPGDGRSGAGGDGSSARRPARVCRRADGEARRGVGARRARACESRACGAISSVRRERRSRALANASSPWRRRRRRR